MRNQARLNAIASSHGRMWLSAIPNPNVGLAVTATCVGLGIPVYLSHPRAKRCVCSHVLDRFGGHVLGSSHGSLTLKHHNAIRDTVYYALLVDNKGSVKEQRCSYEDISRPGDMHHLDVLTGHPAYFDILV